MQVEASIVTSRSSFEKATSRSGDRCLIRGRNRGSATRAFLCGQASNTHLDASHSRYPSLKISYNLRTKYWKQQTSLLSFQIIASCSDPQKRKKKIPSFDDSLASSILFYLSFYTKFLFSINPTRTSKSINPNAMNPQQVRANDSRSWIPRLGNLGQRVGTVVSRCRTPSTQQFVDSFVLHYRGEYRERKRER